MEKEQILKELGVDWNMNTLAVWRRAEFKCEYCRKSLTDKSEEYYFDSHMDHIVPKGGNEIDNFALACKACNFIKRNRDFRRDDAPNTRSALIERAAIYIAGIRERNRGRLKRDLELLRQLEQLENQG